MVILLASMMIEVTGILGMMGIAAIILYGIHRWINHLLKNDKKKRWNEK